MKAEDLVGRYIKETSNTGTYWIDYIISTDGMRAKCEHIASNEVGYECHGYLNVGAVLFGLRNERDDRMSTWEDITKQYETQKEIEELIK